MRTWRSPTTVMTANGEVQTREEATVYVKELDSFICQIGETMWGSWVYIPLDQRSKTTSHQKSQENWLQYIERCPFVVPGLSASSSSTTPSPSSSSSSSQDSVIDVKRYTENPIPERSGSTSEEQRETRCINQQKPKTQIKMKDSKKYRAIYCMTCRTGYMSSEKIWLMKVVLWSHGDTSKSSHGLPMEPRAKVEPGSGKHSLHTHFPKDPNCDICLKTKITRSTCRRCAGTVVPTAENFGD